MSLCETSKQISFWVRLRGLCIGASPAGAGSPEPGGMEGCAGLSLPARLPLIFAVVFAVHFTERIYLIH